MIWRGSSAWLQNEKVMSAEEFRNIREGLSLTRAEFAEALRLRPSFVSSVEDGMVEPSDALAQFVKMIGRSEITISRGPKGKGWSINRPSLKRRRL